MLIARIRGECADPRCYKLLQHRTYAFFTPSGRLFTDYLPSSLFLNSKSTGALSNETGRRKDVTEMGFIIAAIVALGLLGYLIYALFNPGKMS
jgi:K+-transporting ATPase KdpF subunit